MEIQGTDKNSLKAPSSDDFKPKGNILLTEDNHINQEVGINVLRETPVTRRISSITTLKHYKPSPKITMIYF